MVDKSSAGDFTAALLANGNSSFVELLANVSTMASTSRGLHGLRGENVTAAASSGGSLEQVPHGTTIVSLTYPGGVVMAGDRRATAGNVIVQRDIRKVFASDEFGVVGIAGAAGIALELVRLFQVELEHYEKMEGASLSLEGKANRLSALLRGNLGLAMQGLAVVPLFAGYDLDRGYGRIFSYDVTGGRYEEHSYYCVGSGSMFAKGSLKKLYRRDLNEAQAVTACVEALYDAADDDSATGGPDIARGIYPVVAVVSADGVRMLDEQTMTNYVATVVAGRRYAPDGPTAELPKAKSPRTKKVAQS